MASEEKEFTAGPIQGIIADNTELVSPNRIWMLYQLFRKAEADYHTFFDDTASYYLLNIAEFFTGRGGRPLCSYENLIVAIESADYRKVLVMLATEPVPAGKERYRMHLTTIKRDSPQAEQICTWQGLKDFCLQLKLGSSLLTIAERAPQQQKVLDFIESYQFLA
jgi:hypothetical protein